MNGWRIGLATALLVTGSAFAVVHDGVGSGGRAGVRGQPGSGSMRLRAVDGGADFFSRFDHSMPADASYFPIGVWFESVTGQGDVDLDRAAGLNTYVVLTANSDLQLVRDNGLLVIPQWEEWLDRAAAPGSEALAGWTLYDEVDMIEGPEKGPASLDDILDRLPVDDGRIRYNNYGKGVLFWETDQQAARFVNEFQDVVSVDAYWFTDPNICGQHEGGALLNGGQRDLTPTECRRAANYGASVDRVRSLVAPAGSKPVWNFVELGHPSSQEDSPTIRPAEVRAAVWSGIVHGARGIVYFNHSFGGPNRTQHILREPAYADIRGVVTETNRQIKELAPVLNAPFADDYASTSGDVDLMVKYHSGAFWLFAASRSEAPQAVTFKLSCPARTAALPQEGRSLPVTKRSFTDAFADANTVHIYRIEARCS